jgi:cyclopropane fatty-acyl-phospholipid synthase-like methyltransferase
VATPFDWVLSLEVGEHLPKEHEASFIENLHRHNARGVVLSWALEGQGGTGHVNERNNDYIKAQVCAKGYVNDLAAEAALRDAAKFPYFKRTVMVFRRSSTHRRQDVDG